MHGQMESCIYEELFELLIVDEACLLSVDEVEEVLRFVLSKRSADLQDVKLAFYADLQDPQDQLLSVFAES